MARKAKPHEEELPFVALMDTMTNVVGVLIIVLVMIGIGLAKSVQKVLSDLPMVSFEEHKILKDEMAQYDAKRDPAEVQAEITKLQEELKKIADELHALEGEKSKNPNVMVDVDKLAKELEEKRKERDRRKVETQSMLAELDKMKVQLDTTPRYQPPPPVAIRLPNPKPLPENATIHRIFVTEGKLVYINGDQLFNMVEEELKRDKDAAAMGVLKRENLKGPDGKPLTKKGPKGETIVQRHSTFDPAKLPVYFDNLFNRRKPGSNDPNRDVLVKVVPLPNQPAIQLQITPRPDAGELPEQQRNTTSHFRTFLRSVAKDKTAVVWFHVCRDSIAAYHMAREIADFEKVPVGWDIMDKPVYTKNLPGDYMVTFTPAPVPAGGTPAPTGPPPVVIAAPKATLD
jgi:hypothetical protein